MQSFLEKSKVKILKKQFYQESTDILQTMDVLCGTMVAKGAPSHATSMMQLFVQFVNHHQTTVSTLLDHLRLNEK